MHPKNSGGEHLLTEAIEDKNEVNGAEVNVTIEFVEDQSDLVPEPAMEIEVASTSMATETEANLTSQPIVQIEVSSDVTSLEKVNPEGNPHDAFASAEEIEVEIRTHKHRNRYEIVSNGAVINISSKSRKKLPKPAIKVEAFDKSTSTKYKKVIIRVAKKIY